MSFFVTRCLPVLAAVARFVRPGLNFQIVSANVASEGTVTVDYKVTDPDGVALDLAGVQTPGPISASFVLAYIPKGQTQYVTYATRLRTSADGKTTTNVAAADTGGKSTQVNPGEYVYTFGNKVPSSWDPTATHRVGVYGNRNLTEFDLGTNYDDATFEPLWKINVGVGFAAPPMTFETNGRQYVAILSGLSHAAINKNSMSPELKELRNQTMLFVFGL